MFKIIIADNAKQDIKNTLAYIKDILFNPKAATKSVVFLAELAIQIKEVVQRYFTKDI